MAVQKIWTQQINATTLIIDATFGFTQVSILCGTGNTSILGSNVIGGISSNPVTISAGQVITIGTTTSINIIDYLEINASGRTQIIGIT